jgi:hypothetical protein
MALGYFISELNTRCYILRNGILSRRFVISVAHHMEAPYVTCLTDPASYCSLPYAKKVGLAMASRGLIRNSGGPRMHWPERFANQAGGAAGSWIAKLRDWELGAGSWLDRRSSAGQIHRWGWVGEIGSGKEGSTRTEAYRRQEKRRRIKWI